MAKNSSECRTIRTVLVLACCALALLACRQTIKATGSRPSAEVAGDGSIPAAAFFRSPQLAHVTLSPDAAHLAAVFEKDGVEVVVVWERGKGTLQPVASLAREGGRASTSIRGVGWAGNDRLLVSVERPSASAMGVRARESRLMSVGLDGNPPRYLGKGWKYQELSGHQDDIVSWLPDDPNHVLVSLWLPGEIGAGVRRVNVHSGELKLMARPILGANEWAADHRGQVRAGWGVRPNTTENVIWARIGPDDNFEEILRWDPFEGSGTRGFRFGAFSEDPATIFVISKNTAGRDALYSFDLAQRRLGPVVFEHPEADVYAVDTSPEDGRLLAVGYVTNELRLHFFDEDARSQQRGIDEAFPGRVIQTLNSSRNGRYSVIRSSGDRSPPRYHLFDRTGRSLTMLFAAYPELEEIDLAAMDPVEYTARDGLVIHGYLTQPVGVEPPYPTIVFPHGGPWARDVWGWDPVVQFLASRGFAVFQPNFRGSEGYGTDFLERGYGRWGMEMQDDITDGTRWLIDQGIADPERIGIFGASYGGYAALYGLVKEPDLFQAGASLAGVTDIPALLFRDQFYLNLLPIMEKLVGERWGDGSRLAEISPANNAEKIRVPVLIAHGTEDPRVHVEQAHTTADALEDAGVEVELLLYEGEVHGFLDERNRIDFYTKLAAFFERNLAKRGAAEELASETGAGAPAP